MNQHSSPRHSNLLLTVLLTLLGATAACVPYRPFTLPAAEIASLPPSEQHKYRQTVRECTDLMPDAPSLPAGRCQFAVIEFDDQGEFWRPEQLDETLKLINEKSGRNPNREALVVVFVHGWKNNASPKNEAEGNLASFKKVLVNLTADEMLKGEAPSVEARPVIGVYLSWRGLSATGPILKQVSFFGRKNAAERVARVSFSHAIQRIVSTVKGNKSETRGNPNSVVAVVGHSFGGLIVENTLLRTLTIETDDFSEFAADLAVLVNPANEAILARQTVQSLQRAPAHKLELDGHLVSQPLIVSVTSVGDSATGTLFPLALSIKGLFKSMRDYPKDEPGIKKQRFYYTHTPGHSTTAGELYSHTLTCPFSTTTPTCGKALENGDQYEAKMRAMAAEVRAGQRKTIFPPPAVELAPCRRAPEINKGYECIERLSFLGAGSGELYTMDRSETGANQTGYWIMEMPVSIVPDHSDIFQSELASLLSAFINLKDAHLVKNLKEARSFLQGEIKGKVRP